MRLAIVGLWALAALVASDARHVSSFNLTGLSSPPSLPRPRDAASNASIPDTAGVGVPPPPPPPTVDLWTRCKCKGDNLLKAMYASDKDAGQYFKPKREAAQSPFENYPGNAPNVL